MTRLFRRLWPRSGEPPANHPVNEMLIGEIEHARDEAQEAFTITLDLGGNLQSVIDEADATVPLVRYMRPGDAEGMIVVWSSLANQAGELKDHLGEMTLDSDAVDGTASLSSARATGIFTPGFEYFDDPDFQSAWNAYETRASRPQLREDVAKLLIQFGFEKACSTLTLPSNTRLTQLSGADLRTEDPILPRRSRSEKDFIGLT